MITEVQSPCIRNCCLNEVDVCVGCHRTLTDIMQWGAASSAQRTQILAAAKVRKAEALSRRQTPQK